MNLPCGDDVSIGSVERAEEGALGLQPFDHLEEMRQRPRQTVDAHHHQRVAFADPLQHPRQHRPRAVPARGLLLVDLDAACGFQGLRLGQGGLILGRDARIADQGHQNRPFAVSHTTNKRPFVNVRKGRFPRRAEFGKRCIYGLKPIRGAPSLSRRHDPRAPI